MATQYRIHIRPASKKNGNVIGNDYVTFDEEDSYLNEYYTTHTYTDTAYKTDGDYYFFVGHMSDTEEVEEAFKNANIVLKCADGYRFNRDLCFITSTTSSSTSYTVDNYVKECDLPDDWYSEEDTVLSMHDLWDYKDEGYYEKGNYYIFAVVQVEEKPYIPTYYELTQNLLNCSSNITDTEIEEKTFIYYEINANSDNSYYFSNSEELGIVPNIIYSKTGEKLSNQFYYLNSVKINGTTFYKTAYTSFTMSDDITVNASAINPYELVYCTCTENLTNVFTHSHETTFLQGSIATIEVYVPSGYTSIYKINDSPEIQFNNGKVLYFDVDEDRLNASITFTVEDDFIIYAHAEAPKVYHNVIAENLTHCKLTSADTFEENEYYTLELTADDGYVFNDSIECTYNTLTTYIDTFYEDDTVARHTFIPTLWSDIIVVEAVAIRQAEQVSAFAHLYKVTASILNSLSKVRFYEVSSETAEVVDYGEYITNLMEIPFSLPDDIIGDNANIQLGTFDSGVSAPVLLYHDLEVDIGTISVKSKYDNLYDYKDTEAILHLPYAEDITVPLEYVMNEDLHIKYKMDLYSGDVTIILDSSYTGTIVATQVTNICTQIPFIQYQTDSVMNKIDKLTDNGIRTAFIELKRNIPYNVFCEFGKPTVDYGKLSDYKGYIEVSDCTVNVACTKDEQDLISQILKTGIIIK